MNKPIRPIIISKDSAAIYYGNCKGQYFARILHQESQEYLYRELTIDEVTSMIQFQQELVIKLQHIKTEIQDNPQVI